MTGFEGLVHSAVVELRAREMRRAHAEVYASSTSQAAVSVLSSRGDHAWIREYLSPYVCNAVGNGPSSKLLVGSVSSAQWQHLIAALVGHPGGVAKSEDISVHFAADQRELRWVAVSSSEGTSVLLKDHSVPSATLATMRAVRSVLTGLTLDADHSCLHASAIKMKNGVHLLLGDKGAGKTTTLIAILRTRLASLVSNDQVLICSSQGTARGVPVGIGIRAGTRELFPELHVASERGSYHGWDATLAPEKVFVSPRRLASLLGVEIAPEGPVRSLTVVQYDPAARRLEKEPLKVADVFRKYEHPLGSRHGMPAAIGCAWPRESLKPPEYSWPCHAIRINQALTGDLIEFLSGLSG